MPAPVNCVTNGGENPGGDVSVTRPRKRHLANASLIDFDAGLKVIFSLSKSGTFRQR